MKTILPMIETARSTMQALYGPKENTSGPPDRHSVAKIEYGCPTGHALRSDLRKFRNPRSRVTKADTIIYRASQFDCEDCSMKDRCCPNTPFRKIARSIHEAARDKTRRIAKTPEYNQSCRERKKVEMLFAHLKRILKRTVCDCAVQAVLMMSS